MMMLKGTAVIISYLRLDGIDMASVSVALGTISVTDI
jgi:hypothetical protein